MSRMSRQETGSQGATVTMSKLTEGIGILFSGVLTMLESLDVGTVKALTAGYANPDAAVGAEDTEGDSSYGSAAEAANHTAEETDHSVAEATNHSATEATNHSATEATDHNVGAGEAGEVKKAEDLSVTQPAQDTQPSQDTQSAQKSQPSQDTKPGSDAGLTVDDVARIVVQKVKANPGINEKIRALVIAHGAQRVTELKPEVLEAFLTDLCQL